ncbi:hypothetical protein LO772_08185 [Yinghuangia sp. ASG 101]|uniref:hypothetical protein n=1 Tax=Yinghuangia sp. ASG 101 TaxID=2896848 RepID=UPI001E5D9B05|nr:hypothetical protein [Yinghuangia sp. ASG 101]UGQ13571.1 hypothetical protein LO772_08185 [Yinghuangia sp. ASG 101]
MDARRLAQRFPLVPRPRPACTPLPERVRALGELADAAERATGTEALIKAAAVHNLAALIASDCGLPELARALCHRQAATCLRAQPLGAQQARHALEPLVNLARLLIRDGDGEAAYQLLDRLFQAVRTRADAVVDNLRLDLRNLTASPQDHQDVCRWLWTVLLADGTRALVAAERWTDALVHVEQHRGVGHRLLDGRQIAVLAALFGNRPHAALAALTAAAPAEPWEHAVAACLDALCRASAKPQRSHDTSDTSVATAVDRYLDLPATTGLVVFRTRLGATVIELAATAGHHDRAAQAAERLTTEALSDGYAARDLLACPTARLSVPVGDLRRLAQVRHAAGLGGDALTNQLHDELTAAVAKSEAVTAKHHVRTLPQADSQPTPTTA